MAADKTPRVVEFFTLEFEELTPFDDVKQSNIHEAIEYVDQFRKLGDPSYVPVAILRHEQVTRTEIHRVPLNDEVELDRAKIITDVRAKIMAITDKELLTGHKTVDTIVAATLEAIDESQN